jgi:hypothetical protein
MYRIGIVGLPQSGKTTLFNAITGAHGETGAYHAGEHVSHGVVTVPDGRLDALADVLSPREVIPARLEFEDIGGVFAHLGGAEQSGRATAELRGVDCILMVLRAFESEYVPEVLGGVDPAHEYAAMSQELLLADLEVIEHRLATLERDVRKATPERDALLHEQQVLERCRRAVEEEQRLEGVGLAEPDRKLLRSYAFLTLKPRLCVLNIGEDEIPAPSVPEALAGLEPPPLPICAELEMELMDLEQDERAEFMRDAGLKEMSAGRIIRACRGALGLRTFFTDVGDKLQAWDVGGGTAARGAAGHIHSDMERGFIRAEVVGHEEVLACGGVKEARSAGKLRMEGRDYEVRDGDLITFHFSR